MLNSKEKRKLAARELPPEKTDFLNWSLINAGTFDYAGDAWGYTYGAAAEWYLGRFTLRGGIFDMSATPAGGNSPASGGIPDGNRGLRRCHGLPG
jgi:hypothetical protein